jgi:NADPH:quinone reductase-like Zn-dependent oxidoreductase
MATASGDREARRWVAPRVGGPDVIEFVDGPLPAPRQGEVSIDVRAAGMNPVDHKRFAKAGAVTPMSIGFEVSGVIRAIGPQTEIASGGGAVGDEVIAFRIAGGYSTAVTVDASTVFAKPASLDHPQAANLLLVGTTAAEMLHVTGVGPGDTIVIHGASGGVGASAVQQARRLEAEVIGTTGEGTADAVRCFGGVPVRYGAGLAERLREAAPGGFDAALLITHSDEALDTSLDQVRDHARLVTVGATDRTRAAGVRHVSSGFPDSAAFRDAIRPELIALAARGELVVPMDRTFPLSEARAALTYLASGQAKGKVALVI